MGWKNVKDHYRITHIVQVTKTKVDGDHGDKMVNAICIGSSYIHNLIVIGLDGRILKRYDERGNDNLERYMQEMDADLDVLKRLVLSSDTFAGDSITVYTWEGAEILEKQCEAFGWPNVTNDGCLMYENTFSLNKSEVISWAKRNAEMNLEALQKSVGQLQKQILEKEVKMDAYRLQLNTLHADYPENELSGGI